jgi:hypothetical protein
VNWSTYVSKEPVVVVKKWFVNLRIYVEGGHETRIQEAPHSNPETLPLPEGTYSFRLFSAAEAIIVVKLESGNEEDLVLRSEPLDQSDVYFIKEEVQFCTVDQLKVSYPPEQVGALINRMELDETNVCMILPGDIFMPVVEDVNLLTKKEA